MFQFEVMHVQYLVSFYDLQCTCADSGASAGAGAVRYINCAILRVQCAACQR